MADQRLAGRPPLAVGSGGLHPCLITCMILCMLSTALPVGLTPLASSRVLLNVGSFSATTPCSTDPPLILDLMDLQPLLSLLCVCRSRPIVPGLSRHPTIRVNLLWLQQFS